MHSQDTLQGTVRTLVPLAAIATPLSMLSRKLIYVEPHGEDPRVIVITRGGVVIGKYRLNQGKTTKY
jgi:hypothetical protein